MINQEVNLSYSHTAVKPPRYLRKIGDVYETANELYKIISNVGCGLALLNLRTSKVLNYSTWVANSPYISHEEWQGLMQNFKSDDQPTPFEGTITIECKL